MKILRPILFASLLALASPLLAQDAHQDHGSMAAASSTAALESIASAPAAKAGCEKCKQAGMGDKMAGADMEGMSGRGGLLCCKGKQGGDTAALAQRINEREKRLDLMQAQLQRTTR